MPPPPRLEPLPPVTYRPRAGLLALEPESVVRLGLAGHPIELFSESDYFGLFHTMDRMGLFGPYRLLRKETAPKHWLAYIVAEELCRPAGAKAADEEA